MSLQLPRAWLLGRKNRLYNASSGRKHFARARSIDHKIPLKIFEPHNLAMVEEHAEILVAMTEMARARKRTSGDTRLR